VRPLVASTPCMLFIAPQHSFYGSVVGHNQHCGVNVIAKVLQYLRLKMNRMKLNSGECRLDGRGVKLRGFLVTLTASVAEKEPRCVCFQNPDGRSRQTERTRAKVYAIWSGGGE